MNIEFISLWIYSEKARIQACTIFSLVNIICAIINFIINLIRTFRKWFFIFWNLSFLLGFFLWRYNWFILYVQRFFFFVNLSVYSFFFIEKPCLSGSNFIIKGYVLPLWLTVFFITYYGLQHLWWKICSRWCGVTSDCFIHGGSCMMISIRAQSFIKRFIYGFRSRSFISPCLRYSLTQLSLTTVIV